MMANAINEMWGRIFGFSFSGCFSTLKRRLQEDGHLGPVLARKITSFVEQMSATHLSKTVGFPFHAAGLVIWLERTWCILRFGVARSGENLPNPRNCMGNWKMDSQKVCVRVYLVDASFPLRITGFHSALRSVLPPMCGTQDMFFAFRIQVQVYRELLKPPPVNLFFFLVLSHHSTLELWSVPSPCYQAPRRWDTCLSAEKSFNMWQDDKIAESGVTDGHWFYWKAAVGSPKTRWKDQPYKPNTSWSYVNTFVLIQVPRMEPFDSCVCARKSKKIANMSLNMSKKSACNVWM